MRLGFEKLEKEIQGEYEKRRGMERPDSDGSVSWVFSSCSTSVGFLTRYDGELRESLVW